MTILTRTLLAAGCLLLAGCTAAQTVTTPAPVPTTTITASPTVPTTVTAACGETTVTQTVLFETTTAVTTATTVVPTTTTAPPAPLSDSEFVKVRDYIPDIGVDLKYATTDNFTGQVIYGFKDAYLRYGTVKKLIAVQEALREHGLRLHIWDGFRPVSAQFALWEVCPDATYVANSYNGFSSHSRGNTVDVTLIDESGAEVVMPTGFDDFSSLADRDYSDCSAEAAANAMLLESAMKANGFKTYHAEWWHFSDTVSYDVDTEFEP